MDGGLDFEILRENSPYITFVYVAQYITVNLGEIAIYRRRPPTGAVMAEPKHPSVLE